AFAEPAPLIVQQPEAVAVSKPEAFQPAPLPVQQPKSVTVSKPEAFAEPAPLIVQQPEAVAVSKPEAFPEPAPAPPSVQADVEIPALEKSVSPPSTPVASATASYPQTLPVEIAEVSTASSVQQEVLESNTALKPLLVRKTQSDNQRTAQQVADALQRVGLTGYEIEIRFEDGIAALAGEVATVEQLQAARIAASTVQGVNEVQNRLQVTEPIAQTNFVPRRGPVPPVSQASMAMMAGMQATPTSIGGAGAYSNPQLPKHAWPAYAQYPNSAAVSYPTQYSASAWPYIGPFYPYPQVPMGWREVSLEWDDGHWQLDFEKKKDAWYWLFKPKNWK
ncbi:MAG: BON domain-containing protein, partial [Fuerstiella sp.]|nr:BON domain-containing protein [Fuerstiella sp.]